MWILLSTIPLISVVSIYVYDLYRQEIEDLKRLYNSLRDNFPSLGRISSMIKTIKTSIIFKQRERTMNELSKTQKISEGVHELEYVHNGTLYKIRILDHHEPCLFQFVDELDQDVTVKLLPYLGPGFDFHKISYTPRHLGYKKLCFIDEHYNKIMFDEDSTMIYPDKSGEKTRD